MMRNLMPVCIAVVLMLSTAYAESPDQTHASIQAAMLDLVASDFRQRGETFRAETLPLDTRLRLPLCDVPIQAFFPQGRHVSGSLSVGVRCVGSHPWTVYGKVRVRAYREVLVLKNPLRTGHVIAAGDIGIVRKELSELNGDYLTDSAHAVGYSVRRTLAAGAVLGPKDLSIPKMIRRGQRVSIRAMSAGFAVSMSGEALADGSAGERIRVRNEQSARVVEGIIVEPGVVRVGR